MSSVSSGKFDTNECKIARQSYISYDRSAKEAEGIGQEKGQPQRISWKYNALHITESH